ncbi:MAG: hypothetical protein GPJ16_22060 [Microcystis aeruginosa G11-04]|jgi:hypothetical protein|uniref:Uncharacterized protein n=1 Tax=Microcystis aeruginosa G11-04 TaxID=2685956 RepID=A0A966G324_MICAE|nr:hypothetical protein [Microcystis aeruginosa G13-11]NCS59367.1 hypothetical protein [Microcystis aeruginosa G11-04]NCT44974.1 hypothetical protein [Microcystis aeruginosa G11-09]
MEFTATLPITLEIMIKAKNKDEALSFLDDLYPNITIENDGKREIEIVYDNLSLIENDWELED